MPTHDEQDAPVGTHRVHATRMSLDNLARIGGEASGGDQTTGIAAVDQGAEIKSESDRSHLPPIKSTRPNNRELAT
jgi:hypothetical protein